MLKDEPMFKYIKRAAHGCEGDYEGTSMALWQYMYFGTQVHIVAEARYGSCAGCDDDIALEDSLRTMTPHDAESALTEDLLEKLSRLVYFADFQEAVTFAKSKAKRYGVKLEFETNAEKKAEKDQQKAEMKEVIAKEKELRELYPGQIAPAPITLADYM